MSYRHLADFIVPNFRSNGTFGQIPAVVSSRYLFETLRFGCNIINHPLTKISGQGRWGSLDFLDSYDRLDFVVSKFTAKENDLSNFELSILIRTVLKGPF